MSWQKRSEYDLSNFFLTRPLLTQMVVTLQTFSWAYAARTGVGWNATSNN
jgi:hypothetical protein